MSEYRRNEFLTHILPNWLSAIAAVCVLGLTAYTLLAVRNTQGQVSEIMTHMGIAPPGSR